MRNGLDAEKYRRILVVVPNWVGDVVLATPVLAALREHFGDARITYLLRSYVREVVEGGGWHDDVLCWPARKGLPREVAMFRLVGRLRAERFDLAVLLTNSFRSALTTARAKIARRVGYARDGRGWLLTDKLHALKHAGEFVPSPVLPYYVEIAERLGCRVTDRRVRLGITTAQERAGAELAGHYGLDDGKPYAIINPGAAFGSSKCWLPARFGEVCDRLREEFALRAVIVGAANEIPLMRAIKKASRGDVICCDKPGTTLGSLKPLVRDSSLVVCNDTGPRHYGSAFDIPTVTIFGPTHQAWTDTDYAKEIKIQVPVDCGPCQLSQCPLDHRCMTEVATERVMEAVRSLLGRQRGAGNGDAPFAARDASRLPTIESPMNEFRSKGVA